MRGHRAPHSTSTSNLGLSNLGCNERAMRVWWRVGGWPSADLVHVDVCFIPRDVDSGLGGFYHHKCGISPHLPASFSCTCIEKRVCEDRMAVEPHGAEIEIRHFALTWLSPPRGGGFGSGLRKAILIVSFYILVPIDTMSPPLLPCIRGIRDQNQSWYPCG